MYDVSSPDSPVRRASAEVGRGAGVQSAYRDIEVKLIDTTIEYVGEEHPSYPAIETFSIYLLM